MNDDRVPASLTRAEGYIGVRCEACNAPPGQWCQTWTMERAQWAHAKRAKHAQVAAWWHCFGETNMTDSEWCRRCGGPNVVWAAPSPLWNRVMRGNDINGPSKHADLVCIACFCVLAEEVGVQPKRWRVYADPEPEGLINVTPSGRVWNANAWLWEDA